MTTLRSVLVILALLAWELVAAPPAPASHVSKVTVTVFTRPAGLDQIEVGFQVDNRNNFAFAVDGYAVFGVSDSCGSESRIYYPTAAGLQTSCLSHVAVASIVPVIRNMTLQPGPTTVVVYTVPAALVAMLEAAFGPITIAYELCQTGFQILNGEECTPVVAYPVPYVG